MFGPFDYYLDPRRGAVPAWDNRFAVMSWPHWLGFDPHPAAPRITAPTLLVHSREGAIPQGAERFHGAMNAEKELVWSGGTQFDFYDDEATVTKASDLVLAHFNRTLV
jgi:hypothetical protein